MAANDWKTALQTFAALPDPSVLPKDVYHSHSDHTITLYAQWPKSTYHMLVIPRIRPPFTAGRLLNLRTLLHGDKQQAEEVIDQLNDDVDEVVEWIKQQMDKKEGYRWNVWLGFMPNPSVNHLALHVVSGDLVSEHLKNKRHYNEFNPKNGYLIRLKHVLEWFEADAPGWWEMVTRLDPVEYEKKLQEPLQCFHCYEEFRTMPRLKAHLKEHMERTKESELLRMKSKKRTERAFEAFNKKKMEAKAREKALEDADSSSE
ncbi:hypothetical protein FB107DRAFT_222006 [Schizophyllum commune]